MKLLSLHPQKFEVVGAGVKFLGHFHGKIVNLWHTYKRNVFVRVYMLDRQFIYIKRRF